MRLLGLFFRSSAFGISVFEFSVFEIFSFSFLDFLIFGFSDFFEFSVFGFFGFSVFEVFNFSVWDFWVFRFVDLEFAAFDFRAKHAFCFDGFGEVPNGFDWFQLFFLYFG